MQTRLDHLQFIRDAQIRVLVLRESLAARAALLLERDIIKEEEADERQLAVEAAKIALAQAEIALLNEQEKPE